MKAGSTARRLGALAVAALVAGSACGHGAAPGVPEAAPPAAPPARREAGVPAAPIAPPRADASVLRDASGPEPAATATGPETAAASLHRKAIVIDTHSDVTLRLVDEPAFDFGVRHEDGHEDLVRMREGGLDAEFLAVWVKPSVYRGEAAWARALEMLEAIDAAAKAHPDRARLATTAAEIRAAEAEGRIALLVGVEGAHAIGTFDDEAVVMDRVRALHRRGARYMTLTWMNSNPLAGSSGDAGRDRGLTDLGRRVVALMNDLGMMVDVSHVSDRTVFDVLEASRAPVLASHSDCRAKASHFRNVTDEMLRAIAAKGGAVCINFYSGYLDDGWMAARRRAKRAGGEVEVPAPPLSVLIDHIDHAAKVAGVDHVCLGSDFDGVGGLPAGLEDVSRLPAITAALLERGYGAEDVSKILGGNVLRVMEGAERAAKRR